MKCEKTANVALSAARSSNSSSLFLSFSTPTSPLSFSTPLLLKTAPRRPLAPPNTRLTHERRSLTSVITRITNAGSELKLREGNPDDDGVELVELPDGTWAPRVALYEKYVDLGPQYQVPDPEKGPLERRVSTQFLDGLFSDEINLEDEAYWFTCPPEGWDIEHKVLLKATEVDFPRAQQGLRPADEPSAATRRPLLSLQIGEVLEGTVCGMAWTTGVHVDVGSRYNGLLPVKSEYFAWTRGLQGKLRMGDSCRVRVAKIIDAPLCRFPLVLEIVDEPEMVDAFVPIEEYTGAFDLRGAPDAKSRRGGLSGTELAQVMDSLTGGAWSGGAGHDVGAIPMPTGGAKKGTDEIFREKQALEEEVREWLERAGNETKARAKRRGGGGGGASGGDGEEEEEGGGEEGGGSESESETTRGSRKRRDGDDDEDAIPGLSWEEGVDSDLLSGLDGAVAGLW